MSLLDTASLIVTPNGYKEGKLYSVIPSDGSGDLSVTRATTATRVNSAGLVELVPYNLVEYSEAFDNAYWTKTNTTITANATTDPNGNLIADKLVENSANDIHFINSGSITFSAGNYSISIYAKASERNVLQIFLNGSANVDAYANFNLTTGVVSAFDSCTATIQSVGNGWYRCNLTTSVSASVVPSAYFCIQNSTTATRAASYSGNGTSGLYIWGAQLVEGSTAKDYQKTETRLNIPRLDYSNGTCPSLLVEPQRTNVLNYSEDFENIYWYEEPGNSVTSNTTISPSGIQNADTFTAVGGSEMNIHNVATFPLTTGTYTYSVYLKNNGTNLIEVYLYQIGPGFVAKGEINFSAETFTASIGTGTITNVGNGWYRVTLTNSVTAGDFTTGVYTTSTTGTRSVFVWGAQLEAGSYATSYIPTTSASVTRNADVISKTGISSLIGQTEGTIFCELDRIEGAENMGIWMRTGASAYNEMIAILINPDGTSVASIRSSATNQFVASGSALSSGKHKFALAYKNNDFAFYIDGTQIATSTSGTPPTCDQVYLGGYPDGGARASKNVATALWKTRLDNATLATLTTL